ncbi:uncharacterized protein LOC130283407 [Hyla sarda]|uniref:uncharacterized protein LOC130283407 n=1 Tax=Hyla sarda TaxID=327740 RepID=UPI0024C4055A|nr:uncharacterized protein LOC130283407 [Hyla sarda]
MGNSPAAWIFLTILLLRITEPGECKVYYDCGAVLYPSGRDLILSSGFPNNYLPGSHCLWQILVPAGYTIVLETLDFDVFDSASDDESPTSYIFPESSSHSEYKQDRKDTDTKADLTNNIKIELTVEKVVYENGSSKQVSIETWSKTENKNRPMTELQGLATDQNLVSPMPSTISAATGKYESLTDEINKPMYLLAAVTNRMATEVSEGARSISIGTDPFTIPPPVPEMCPIDVLYITDLVTYSSRFCGSISPINKILTFGSPVEMTEVILELITATNRGRGFAILLSYHNQSLVTTMGVQERRGREGVVLLAVIAATISFALVLLLVLCLSYRQKICHKREHSDNQITTQVNGILNTALDVNELQLVVSDEDLQKGELEHGSQVEGVADVSQQSQQDDPSSCTITVTDSNSDEVFVISPGNHSDCLTFNSSHLQVGNLKRSVTSPASVSDWLTSDYTSVDLTVEDKANKGDEVDPVRQRAWSMRTFNSLLPQLQMKWRSRTSSGSFTKLVDSGSAAPVKNLSPNIPRRAGSAAQIGENVIRLYSESSDSNASYPLTHSAHLHRNLPSGNLRRTQPCFGLLSDSSDCVRCDQTSAFTKENSLCQKPSIGSPNSFKIISTNGMRAKELPMDFEKPNTVFVICEEADDQQPLVFDDQLSSPTDCESHSADIGCIDNNCTLVPKRSCTHLSPWMKSSDASIYQCIQKNLSLGSLGSLNSHCTTTVGRPDYQGSKDFQSPPVGLVTE